MDARLEVAIRLRQDKRFDEARPIFEALVAEFPENAQVVYQYAWFFDAMGEEQSAIPHYEKAIALGTLSKEDLRSAMLGLGSTYRCVGLYQKAEAILRKGMAMYGDGAEFAVFLAMTLYNLERHQEAMILLLKHIGEAASNQHIKRYKKAILFYADNLDEVW